MMDFNSNRFSAAILGAFFMIIISLVVLWPAISWLYNFTLTLRDGLNLHYSYNIISIDDIKIMLAFVATLLVTLAAVWGFKVSYRQDGLFKHPEFSVLRAAYGGIIWSILGLFILVYPLDRIIQSEIIPIHWGTFSIIFGYEWLAIGSCISWGVRQGYYKQKLFFFG